MWGSPAKSSMSSLPQGELAERPAAASSALLEAEAPPHWSGVAAVEAAHGVLLLHCFCLPLGVERAVRTPGSELPHIPAEDVSPAAIARGERQVRCAMIKQGARQRRPRHTEALEARLSSQRARHTLVIASR